jgi:hypothetical protein
MRKFMLLAAVCFGAVEIAAAASPALAQTTQKPPHQTYVPAHQTAVGQLKAAAQGPTKAAGTFDGRRGTASTPVKVRTSTSTVSAATIAKQQNAAERARQAQTSRKYGIDKIHVP